MPSRLKRIYGFRDLHFITCSCYRRRQLLGTRHARDVFLRIFDQVRRKYKFEVVGCVVMPEHFHILIGEPEKGNPSTVLQILKQIVARRLLKTGQKATKQSTHAVEGRSYRSEPSFRQARFYDFNVYSNEKRFEKLRYMHRNPVRRGLVSLPELWPWSSFRAYMYAEPSIVKIDELERRNIKKKPEPK